MMSRDARLARGEVAIFGDVVVREAVREVFDATVSTL